MDFGEEFGGWEAAVSVGALVPGEEFSKEFRRKSYLANAYVMRLLVVMILVVAKRRQTSGKLHMGKLDSAKECLNRGTSSIHKETYSTSIAARRIGEYLKKRPCSGADDVINVAGHK